MGFRLNRSRLINFLLMIAFAMAGLSCSDSNHSPETKGEPSNRLDKLATEIDFEDVSVEILQNASFGAGTCVGCHSSYRSYSNVVRDIDKIIERINLPNSDSRRMPPRGNGFEPIDSERIAFLENWLANGLKQSVDAALPTTPFGFEDVKSAVLTQNCIGCHTQYEHYEVVQNEIGKITAVISQGTMPLVGKSNNVAPLDQAQRYLIETWAAAGAPEKANEPAQPAMLLPLEPTYISLQQNVFGPKCIMCHNSVRLTAGLDLSSLEAIEAKSKKNDEFFDDVDPHNSHLIGSILGRAEQFFFDPMPPPPPISRIPLEAVTPEELKTIVDWIAAGRPSGL